MKKKKLILFTVASLIVFFTVSGYVYKNYKAGKSYDLELLERPYSFSIGGKSAKVHLVEFFDPACGTCAQFHPFVKNIMKNNKDKIRLTYRYAPYHKGSDEVVKILEAARKQGKFSETLEMLFRTQSNWIDHHNLNLQIIWKNLSYLEIDMDKMVVDVQNEEFDKIITQDLIDAKRVGANKTPSYFVNGKPLKEFGFKQLEELIYSEL